MNNLQNAFIEDAVKHGEAISKGNHKEANKLHARLTAIYEELKRLDKLMELKEIVSYNDESVKLWSATFLLKYDTDFALKELQNLAKSPKIVGLMASTNINMWNKGMLSL